MSYISPHLHVDYGRHIEVGENFMQIWIAFLDVNKIIFGDNVMVGPRASFILPAIQLIQRFELQN